MGLFEMPLDVIQCFKDNSLLIDRSIEISDNACLHLKALAFQNHFVSFSISIRQLLAKKKVNKTDRK